jgi:phenylpyruvate tautomerase PptA (4-oxalocrotonate tautomerase family)
MPYLQLDVPERYPADVKRELARSLGALYARIMQTSADRVVVGFRELPDGSLWRCGDGGPTPAAVLMCEIRHGRSPQQRADLAQALIDACVKALGLGRGGLIVEFTQHTGDEIFRDGRGWVADWTPTEAHSAT